MTTVHIVSLNYSPGLAKEFTLLGEQFRARGWGCRYLLDDRYDWLLSDDTNVDWVDMTGSLVGVTLRSPMTARRCRTLFLRDDPDVVLFYNTSPVHLPVALLAQWTGATVVSMIHEPHYPDKTKFGSRGRFKLHGAEAIQSGMVRLSNTVVVPSRWSYNLFQRKYGGVDSELLYAPLLVPDVAGDRRPFEEREYVTWVGHLNQARALDEFFALARHAVAADADYRFQVVTSSDVSDAVAGLEDAVAERVDFVTADRLTDEAIADALDRSIAILLTHTHVAQSGNVPVAFRHGAPVIARELPGFTQDVSDDETGYLLPLAFDDADAFTAIESVSENFERISRNARKTYEKRFGPDAWERYYGEFAERFEDD